MHKYSSDGSDLRRDGRNAGCVIRPGDADGCPVAGSRVKNRTV
jgi:hypothetical protein